jgi:hypothetical protein
MTVVPTILFSLAVSLYSRSLIKLHHHESMQICDENHSLRLSMKEVIQSSNDFYGLESTDLFILEDNLVCAFACGFNKEASAIYISVGLLSKFDHNCCDRRLCYES